MEKRIENLKQIVYEITQGVIELRESEEQLELLKYVCELAESEELTRVVELIEEYRMECHRCAYCGEVVNLECSKEEQGEYFGVTVYEPIYFEVCPHCGWEGER